jgi:hypothetical protein
VSRHTTLTDDLVQTVDLVLTIQKPSGNSNDEPPPPTKPADATELITRALADIPKGKSRNPSHVYAAVLRDAIRRRQTVDDLHFADVLVALRNAGYGIDPKTGLLIEAPQQAADFATAAE